MTFKSNDHIYRMVKESNSNIWPNQTIVSDQSELTIILCQPMIIYVGLTAAAWYSGLQLLPSYIWSLIFSSHYHPVVSNLSPALTFVFSLVLSNNRLKDLHPNLSLYEGWLVSRGHLQCLVLWGNSGQMATHKIYLRLQR